MTGAEFLVVVIGLIAIALVLVLANAPGNGW